MPSLEICVDIHAAFVLSSILHFANVTIVKFMNSALSIMLTLLVRYSLVGLLNTAIHWAIFAVCLYGFHTNQALANFAGFLVAVSFSFFANAGFTFKSSMTSMRYILFVSFMGTLSVLVGWTADKCALPPLATLVTFSAISLLCGFVWSRFIVFRDAK